MQNKRLMEAWRKQPRVHAKVEACGWGVLCGQRRKTQSGCSAMPIKWGEKQGGAYGVCRISAKSRAGERVW